MKLNKQDLLMLWRFSQFESVRLVAQNADILKLLLAELEPMFQYNRVVNEYNDPRYHAHFKRLFRQANNPGHHCSHDCIVHPGRWLVHVIFPQINSWPYWQTPAFQCEDINLYGCMIQTKRQRWPDNGTYKHDMSVNRTK